MVSLLGRGNGGVTSKRKKSNFIKKNVAAVNGLLKKFRNFMLTVAMHIRRKHHEGARDTETCGIRLLDSDEKHARLHSGGGGHVMMRLATSLFQKLLLLSCWTSFIKVVKKPIRMRIAARTIWVQCSTVATAST